MRGLPDSVEVLVYHVIHDAICRDFICHGKAIFISLANLQDIVDDSLGRKAALNNPYPSLGEIVRLSA
jgi:hypothetical protein